MKVCTRPCDQRVDWPLLAKRQPGLSQPVSPWAISRSSGRGPRSTPPRGRYSKRHARATTADLVRRSSLWARVPTKPRALDRRASSHTATGIRTRVSAMRGRRPSPLDDSGALSTGAEASKSARPESSSTPCSRLHPETVCSLLEGRARGRSTGSNAGAISSFASGTRMWRNW
jgi:hypothetical protein